MAVFAFRCPGCLADAETMTRTPPICDRCDVPMLRRWGFAIAKPMAPHFNASTGRYVSNERAFKDQLKELSDRQSAATGMDIRLEPTDPADRKAVGVTDEGLDATRRQARDSGLV